MKSQLFKLFWIGWVGAASALISGCGSSTPAASNATTRATGSNSGFGSTSSGSSTATNPSSSTGNTNLNPILNESVYGVGYSSVTLSAKVNKVLKVIFIPGQQNTTVAGTGYYNEYSHLGVYITVGSSTQDSGMLGNGYNGAPQQESQILDFSSAFTATCPVSEPSCRQSVTITISHPNNDFQCLNGVYCPWSQVPAGSPWNGTLQIQTDDTVSL